ncbi:GNAT family N-acetyltransferase [Myceligenerans pegani]|uniref:N-acetyltransferase n=1 Tax=Myceligenerans pegani TaxID=2776917 RepID=A0ABR9N1B4_9MICO|nr:GNAT family N-acetyltransferase [Myceligenerans sp. TRM 65318]MBE1877011.1 N-acetyltransferase [Myceligenerans sp. TRM 65318]MBE3019282.1 N-acetyltransferase [Myceligenerans sp. TRM 65318]
MTELEYDVVDNIDASRYEARLTGGAVAGFLEYRTEGDRIVMPSTVVNPQHRGYGVAARLARTALEDARAAGKKVEPICWYVAEYIEKHPEYADLVG